MNYDAKPQHVLCVRLNYVGGWDGERRSGNYYYEIFSSPEDEKCCGKGKRDAQMDGVVKKGCRKSKQAPGDADCRLAWLLWHGMAWHGPAGWLACTAQHCRLAEGRLARLCFVRIEGRLRKSDGGFHFCC